MSNAAMKWLCVSAPLNKISSGFLSKQIRTIEQAVLIVQMIISNKKKEKK